MKDSLEKFVQNNREEFDVFEPSPELWQHICRELPPQAGKKEAKVINIKLGSVANFSTDHFFMRVAAAILLLLGCGLTLVLVKQDSSGASTSIASVQAANNVAPELPEIEAYYASQIEKKKTELSEYDLKILGLDEQQVIDNELARLDSSYVHLKKQLYTTPNTDEIVAALIQNLQIRIKVLNKQLEVLQNLKNVNQELISEPKNDDTTNA
ncbi:hypothetical protein [Pontibacter oryzae]|uniref:Anti-sigma factor n=1 Tax=Pontibacter oryzae TaxID=2304593 RepID=A0A399S0K7_9BACT|nr:hypothetical protein [Pontibacter oryzae]RIJ36821.1 hypothetical protein D1627_13385 [Pontibacter oryzae]